MTKLPPVRKRRTYQEIGENDLVAALFYDRIADAHDPDKLEQRDDQDAAAKLTLREQDPDRAVGPTP
jgi:hypothetical protein